MDTRRQTPPQSIPARLESPRLRGGDEGSKPSSAGTVGAALNTYAHCHPARSEDAPRRYVAQRLIAVAGKIRPSELRAHHVQATQKSYPADIKRSTRYVYNRALRFLLKALEAEGAPELSWAVDRTKPAMPRTTIFSTEEMATLRQTTDPALRFLIAAGSEAGMRFSTVMALRPADVVDGCIIRQSKAGGQVKIPVSRELARCMAAVPAGTSPTSTTPYINLLVGRDGKLHSLMRDRWRKWLVKAGLRKELRFHDLRRGLARRVYHETHDARIVQSLLSHRNLQHTLGYLCLQAAPIDPNILAAAIDGPARA